MCSDWRRLPLEFQNCNRGLTGCVGEADEHATESSHPRTRTNAESDGCGGIHRQGCTNGGTQAYQALAFKSFANKKPVFMTGF